MNKTCLKSAVLLAGLASAVAVMGACATTPVAPPPPPSPCTTPEPLRISLTASTRLNPGEHGESLPTLVRIYQLKDTAKLIEASLDQILDGDRALLGEDLVSMQELTLYPGERSAPAMPRSEAATSLAVVAMFRRPAGPSWRAIRKLPPPDPQHCHGTVATPAALAASQLKFTLEDSRVDMR
jgi:type VI secretion system VasD/TssJ family lipoprotein